MYQNAPIINIGNKNNVNFNIITSVTHLIPKNCIKEKMSVGTIKYRTNLGIKNIKPRKKLSKICPNLLSIMLFSIFLIK